MAWWGKMAISGKKEKSEFTDAGRSPHTGLSYQAEVVAANDATAFYILPPPTHPTASSRILLHHLNEFSSFSYQTSSAYMYPLAFPALDSISHHRLNCPSGDVA
ncbi:hypothetical protein BD769DRAFT_1384085 [Suillus cothurnatus]|nr:hypothetical protein BD769DRAFT_1384085 [Suillus cothurnatus]